MAAIFSSVWDNCEGENCEAITDVTYYVKEKKKLCEDCASKEGCIGKARKGGSNLYCVKHDEEIKLYCKTHGVALCYSCAHIDHHEQPCVRQDIEGAIMESRAKLNILKEKANDKLKLCRVNGDQIHQCRKDTDTHLQVLTDEVDSVIDEAIEKEEEREKRDAAKINQEFDEKNQKLQKEIQKINEKIRENDEERDKLLKLNCTIAEKRREPIDKKQHGLQTDIQNITEEKEKKIVEYEKTWQDDTKTTETTIQTLDRVLEDDKNIVKDGHHVKTSVSDELKKPLSLNGGEVKQITCTLSGVRFLKGAGAGREKYDGRIDGYDGEWKLIDTINVSDEIKYPTIAGCIDECNLIISDRLKGSHHTYMLDINTKHTQRVITSSGTSWIDSCTLLNDEKVVCGKYSEGCAGDSLTGYVSVYDRQWKHINDVTIPRSTTRDYTLVDVAVDQDGMIIAAEGCQSKIYVINPADGKIMNTITCTQNIMIDGGQWKHINDVAIPRSTVHRDITAVDEAADQDVIIIAAEGGQSKIYVYGSNPADGKIMNTITCTQNIRMDGALSSGHIIAQPSPRDHRVFIIDRQGAKREIPHSDVILNACIDPMTDDLYVVTSDDECKTCVIDQVISGGDMKKRRVASFPLSTRLDSLEGRGSQLVMSCVMITSSGNMIACDGANILVFKKLLSL